MIRPASVADAVALAGLHDAAFPEPWTEAAFADLLTASGCIALMTESGFILIRALAGEAEILTLAVAPIARGRGLGRRLVDAGAQASAQAGAERMFLEVAADNAAALALYAAAGFEPVGRRTGYYRRAKAPPMDALVLRKTLTPLGA